VKELKRISNTTSLGSLVTDFQEAIHAQPALVESVRARFSAVLIDEFQDTDPIQYDIFRTLFLDEPEKPKENLPTSVFFVGDPKQSIYGFRSAELDTYNLAKEQIRAIRGEKALLQLPMNYRSTPALVETVNAFFSLPKSFLSDIDFFDSKFSEAAAPILERHTDEFGADYFEPIPAFECWTNSKESISRLSNTAVGKLENECIAFDIARLLREDREGRPVFYRKPSLPLEAKDIAILVRSRNHAKEIIKLLGGFGIRTRIKSDESVYETSEAVELHTVLQAAIFPENDTLLTQALATPFIGATLSVIQNNVDARVTFKGALSEFIQLAERKGVFPAFAFLERQYRTLERLLPVKDGERKLTNYRQILELLQIEQRNTPNPRALAVVLGHNIVRATQGENTEDTTVRIENNSNVVNVVTIHASKGLEYPVVYLAKATENSVLTRFNRFLFREGKGDARRFLASPTGANPKSHLPTMHREEEECVRLAYVAMTRASSRLVLPLMLGIEPKTLQHHADSNDPAELPYSSGHVRSSYIRSLFGESAYPKDAKTKENLIRAQKDIKDSINVFEEILKNRLTNRQISKATLDIYAKQNGEAVRKILPARLDIDKLVRFCTLPCVHKKLKDQTSSLQLGTRVRKAEDLPNPADTPISLYAVWQRPSFTSISRKFLEQPFEMVRNSHGFQNFMAGAEAGDFLHKLIEKTINIGREHPDFVSREKRDEFRHFIEEQFAHAALFKSLKADDPTPFSYDPEVFMKSTPHPDTVFNARRYHLAWLLQFFDALLDQPLFSRGPSLAQLIAGNRLVSELEFHLNAAPGLTTILPESIAKVAFGSDLTKVVPEKEFGKFQNVLNGFLIGEIDLLFKDDAGKYWVVDWKSNKIETQERGCDNPANYTQETMGAVMDQHYYRLQAMLYLTALYRYIKGNDPKHDPRAALDQIGGAVYVFMRGIGGDPEFGRFHMGMDVMEEKILQLDALFSAKESM